MIQKSLYSWYQKNKRDLPWRHTHDPYAIWISEIMLQQTQVNRVKDFYRRFLDRFPVVEDLARASWDELLEYWRGLGYYRRARNLHQTACIIVKDYGGKFPQTFEELKKLPGIGAYTAAAIASFAFGQDLPAIDTNLQRVLAHIFGGELWDGMSEREKFEFAKKLISKGKGADFNHALMDLGASGILDSEDAHRGCPFIPSCTFQAKPARFKSTLVLRDRGDFLKVAAGVLIHEGKILICKRPAHKPFGGLWEFPGGKLEAGEDERGCLKREMQEELGIEVAVRPPFHKVFTEQPAHARSASQKILLSFHRCSLLAGEPKALEVDEFVWVKPAELFNYQFPPVNGEVIELLLKKKAMFYN